MAEDAEYGLILPFDSDEPEFTRGFEAGALWERLKNQPGFEGTVHAENAEMVMRIAEATGCEFSGEDVGDGWLHVRLIKPQEV